MPCFTLRSLGISQICSCRRTIRRLRRLPLSSKPSCSVTGKCFGKKREENATPFCDAHELCRLLKASANAGRRPDIIGFHTQILKCGLENQFFLQNTLVHSYLKCGVFESARKLFDQMSEKNVVSWNSMISGYAQNGFHEDALGLFREMRRQNVTPTNFTFPSVMKACGAIGRLAMAREFHNEIIRFAGKIEFDVAIQNALIDMYAKCAGLMDARQVFDGMTERDIFSWNAMLSGYLCNGRIQEALEIFWKIPVKNVVSWNALIQGLSQAGRHQEALALLFPMKSSAMNLNQYGFCISLGACSHLLDVELGKQLHGHVIRTGFELNVVVGNALIDMYTKCGNVEHAYKSFSKMFHGYYDPFGCASENRQYSNLSVANVVSWNAMLAGFAQKGQHEKALKLFSRMLYEGLKPDEFTYSSTLKACATIASLAEGQQVHGHLTKTGYESASFVGSGLIDMYAKCGNIDASLQVFDNLNCTDVVSWSALILGLAQHGLVKEALQFFDNMLQSEIFPNEISFLGVLFSCSHAGLVEEGLQYFNSMSRDYGISPRTEHYVCMVDLLGRSGHLDEAETLISNMKSIPDNAVWGSLLAACRMYGNIEMAKRAAERLGKMESQDAGKYVLLSNIYAAAGSWDAVAKVRRMMEESGVKKQPGCSWIEGLYAPSETHAYMLFEELAEGTCKRYLLNILDCTNGKGLRGNTGDLLSETMPKPSWYKRALKCQEFIQMH